MRQFKRIPGGFSEMGASLVIPDNMANRDRRRLAAWVASGEAEILDADPPAPPEAPAERIEKDLMGRAGSRALLKALARLHGKTLGEMLALVKAEV